VYNYFHIGNARPFIIFDVLRRYLEYKGFGVKFVQNFTDIDDKLINKASEEGVTVKDIADKYIAEYFVDAKGLGIREATLHPRATENIDAIIDIIKTLEDKGFAYNVDGDVYFSTKKFEGYGKLSHQPLEDLEAGARIDVSEVKRDPTDFALWKKTKNGGATIGCNAGKHVATVECSAEPSWDSPWGKGRPGWHIECSAMANKYLGKTIDIHSGGKDLVFPHHENEIAQSEAANGQTFSNYWVHNGYINVDNRKMSKSLGNFFTVRDVAEKYGYDVVRFFMLSSHYRSPISFGVDVMESSKSALERIRACVNKLEFMKGNAGEQSSVSYADSSFAKEAYIATLDQNKQKFIAAMEDDLNTADAIAAIFDIVSLANKNMETLDISEITKTLDVMGELCDVLRILQTSDESSELSAEAEALIAQRAEARANKDWAKSDEIRDKLKNMGIIVEDTSQGQKITTL